MWTEKGLLSLLGHARASFVLFLNSWELCPPRLSGASTFWRVSPSSEKSGHKFPDLFRCLGVSPFRSPYSLGLIGEAASRRKWTQITPVKPRPGRKLNLRRWRPKWAITRANGHSNSGKWGKRRVIFWHCLRNLAPESDLWVGSWSLLFTLSMMW